MSERSENAHVEKRLEMKLTSRKRRKIISNFDGTMFFGPCIKFMGIFKKIVGQNMSTHSTIYCITLSRKARSSEKRILNSRVTFGFAAMSDGVFVPLSEVVIPCLV